MSANEKTIDTFAARVRQLIFQYNELKKENDELYGIVENRDNEIKKLKSQVAQWRKDYDSLKMAKMIEIGEGDMKEAQKRITKLIRDINKCITLLSEK